jgi:integrase
VSVPIKGTAKRRWANVRGTKAEALDELDRMLRANGTRTTSPGGYTVADLLREWLAVAELEDTTRADYESVIRLHLPHEMARTKVAKVTAFDLDRLYQTLRKAGVGEHRIRRLHTILRRSYAQAVKWRWVDHNPVIDATPPRVKKAEIRPPSPGGVKVALGEAGLGIATWLRLAAATGARRGEVCGLRWEDIDSGHVWIRRSVAYTPATGVYVKDTKTHQVRRVPLDALTLAAVDAWRADRDSLPDRTKPDRYIFSNATDALTPWRPDYVNRPLRKLGLHPHGLRHFVATQLTAAGVDPRTIAERLGHERVSTTLDMYSHWAEGTGRTAADLMGDILG